MKLTVTMTAASRLRIAAVLLALLLAWDSATPLRADAAAVCTVVQNCSGHATNVTALASSCVCNCTAAFGSSDCSACAPGYTSYPSCIDECTNVNVSCSGHANSVSGVYPACVCSCRTGYTGSQCQLCAPGYIEYYDRCEINTCTAAITCYGKGSVNSDCTCACANGYGGPRCERCADGYGIVPPDAFCVNLCSNANASCNNRAAAVVPDPINYEFTRQCVCTCIPPYAGDESQCDSCIDGYTLDAGSGDCLDACSDPLVSCNNHATSVVPDGSGGCTCSCTNGKYDPATRCGTCAANHYGYPFCDIDDCSSVHGSCNSRASGLNFTGGVCQCTCLAGYTGARCASCATGFIGWPDCGDACSDVAVSCHGRASAVRSNPSAPGECLCTCLDTYAGARCERCALGFNGSAYPSCADQCLYPNASCKNGALSVVPVGAGACQCTCRTGFSGSLCQLCATGYSGYPYCDEDCSSTTVSCSGRASAVAGSRATSGNCSCACHSNWAGRRCDTCNRGYSGATCASCATGFVLSGGVCLENCTANATTCNGNGAGRQSGAAGNCTCACDANFAPPRCASCLTGYVMAPHATIANKYVCIAETCTQL
jgi:laminin alpha 1/2